MRKNFLALLAVAIFCQTFVSSNVVLAQAPTASAARVAPSNCPYEMCALRIEPGFFGRRALLVGIDGVRRNFGLHADGLINVVDRVPAALAEAQLGRRNAIVSDIVGVVGALGVVVALNATTFNNVDKVRAGQFFGALAIGGAGTIVSAAQRVYAERHYSRSVWLYNRELTH